MSTTDIKAPNSIILDKQFKLSYFVPEFSQFRTDEDKTRIECQSIDDSLFTSTKKGKKIF